VIAAYNNMAKMRDPGDGEALLIGLEAFIPLQAQIAAGHNVVSAGYGRPRRRRLVLGAPLQRAL